MARRRVVYPVDTSDWMANIVMGFLVVAAVALIALIVFIDSEGEQVATEEAATEVPSAPGGAATVVPSPTADSGGAVADTEPDDPVTDRADEPDVVVPPASEPVTPLRPRGQRSEPGVDDTVPPPAAGDPDVDEPADGDPDVVEPTPDGDPDVVEPVPDEPAPDDDAAADDPAGTSPMDDPDRVPTLVVSDTPVDVHTVLADLDGDDVEERVWAGLVRNMVHVRVQRDASGGRWTDTATTTGAVADDLISLEVEDLTGDGRPEIHTLQWVGVNGESVSLWSYADDRLSPMTASGGCWDGETTFGVVGARVDPGQVIAICEEDPLPTYLWATAVYRWVDGMWTFQRRVGVYD